MACPISGAFELCKIQIPTYSLTLPGWGVVGQNINILVHKGSIMEGCRRTETPPIHIKISTKIVYNIKVLGIIINN